MSVEWRLKSMRLGWLLLFVSALSVSVVGGAATAGGSQPAPVRILRAVPHGQEDAFTGGAAAEVMRYGYLPADPAEYEQAKGLAAADTTGAGPAMSAIATVSPVPIVNRT